MDEKFWAMTAARGEEAWDSLITHGRCQASKRASEGVEVGWMLKDVVDGSCASLGEGGREGKEGKREEQTLAELTFRTRVD